MTPGEVPAFTTALGFAMPLGSPTPADHLMALGMHRSDRRFGFALAALPAVRPVKRAQALRQFCYEPTPIPLPAPANPLSTEDLAESTRDQIEMVRASVCNLASCTAPAAVWILLSSAFTRGQESLLSEPLHTITHVLQSIGETHVARVDAACFYAISLHPEWRRVGLAFLAPVAGTFASDWIDARPEYRQLARDAREYFEDVPAWLCGAG